MFVFTILIEKGVIVWMMRVTRARVKPITSMVHWKRLLVNTGVQPIMSFNYLRQLVLYNIVVLGNDQAVLIPPILSFGIVVSRSIGRGRVSKLHSSLTAYDWGGGDGGVLRLRLRRRIKRSVLLNTLLSMSPAHAIDDDYFVAVFERT
jgi:hypothetical protein